MRESASNERFQPVDAPVRLDVLPPRHVQHLTSYHPDVARGGQSRHFGVHTLPGRVGLVHAGQPRVLCLGPGEWWLVHGDGRQAHHSASATSTVEDGWVLTDLSAGESVLGLSGPNVRRVLSRGCSLDLDVNVFPANRCARTRFAQISVVMDFIQSPDRFELYVARSLSAYLFDWLKDALE